MDEIDSILAHEEYVRRQDPLESWRCSSKGQEDYIRAVSRGLFVYAHGGNGCGKSMGGGALDLAFLAGRSTLRALDGTQIQIPVIEPPVHWLLGVKSYKLGALGPVQAIRTMLGDWPHEEGPIKADNCPGVFHIKHRLATRRDDWSQLFIVPYEGESPEGPRVDGWRGDEIPPIIFVGAFQSRMKAGRRLYASITATPILKREWEPILKLFPDPPGEARNGRVRYQWSVFDNEAMPEWQRRERARASAGDPWEQARLYGEHVNVGGANPWSYEVLARWKARCTEPKVERLIVQAEKDVGSGKRVVEIACDLEVWDEPGRGDSYYIPLDPSKGIRDRKHDPDGLQVWSIKRNRLVARVNEYLGGYGLGSAAAILARRYNNALVDPAVTGGYGEGILTGLRVSGYSNINRQQYFDRTTGVWSSRLGFDESSDGFAGKIRSAIDRAIVTDSCSIPSSAVIESLQNCEYDDKGKIVATSGYHDEDLILAGRAQMFIGGREDAPGPEPVKESFEQVLERSMGRPIYAPRPNTEVIERW